MSDAARAYETGRLRGWKREAVAVLDQWDSVHEALGAPAQLGESKAVASAREARRLTAEVARLRAGIERHRQQVGHLGCDANPALWALLDTAMARRRGER